MGASTQSNLAKDTESKPCSKLKVLLDNKLSIEDALMMQDLASVEIVS